MFSFQIIIEAGGTNILYQDFLTLFTIKSCYTGTFKLKFPLPHLFHIDIFLERFSKKTLVISKTKVKKYFVYIKLF